MTFFRSPLVQVAAFALVFRVISMLLAFAMNVAFPLHQPRQFSVVEGPHPFWNSFARYDSGWYWSIAQDGYRYFPHEQNTFAYFPLYPILMRAGGELLGGGRLQYVQAGIAISWASFVAAMVMLYWLARLDVDDESARRAVLYAAVFPFAFFYGMVYSESLFLVLILTTFYAFRKGSWLLGSVAGAMATATRVNGILVIPAVAYLAWQRAGSDRREQLFGALAVGGVATGFVIFSLFTYAQTGSFLESMHSIQRWGYEPGGAPWEPLIALARQLVRRPYEFIVFEPNGLYDTLNGVTAMIFVAAVPFVWHRLGTAYGMYMALNLLLPLSSGQFEGLGRYCAVLFPFFIWIARWPSTLAQQLIGVGFAGAYAVYMRLFVKLHPIF